MILCIDTTENAGTELKLLSADLEFRQKISELPRAEDFVFFVAKFLKKYNFDFSSISKIAVKNGPGYFSRIRTGIVLANALAYALKVKVMAFDGDLNFQKLNKIKGSAWLKPAYDAEPHITMPKRRS